MWRPLAHALERSPIAATATKTSGCSRLAWHRVVASPSPSDRAAHCWLHSSSRLGAAAVSSGSEPADADCIARGTYDVVVVGGGHAGCEAAHIAAQAGARTVLITNERATIGVLSCNPSMGGIGKGTLIREVDSLGGLIGRVADAACIQFRLLNTSKGPAVMAPRMQLDRERYRRRMQQEIANTPNLTVLEGSVEDLILQRDAGHNQLFTAPSAVGGVILRDGSRIHARAVVLTTGTFLQGKLLLGRSITAGGRRSEGGVGPPEAAATKLALTLRQFNFPLARMRTGTPPRLDARTIDFDLLDSQQSHQPVRPFSFLHTPADGSSYRNPNPLLACHRTNTTAATHAIVREAVAAGAVPQYESAPGISRGAAIGASNDDSNGPRYCPSLEAKVVRFASRDFHAIMLEPEGLDSSVIYPQGLEISMGEEYQMRIVRSLPGLSRALLLAHGYAVEYDHLDPRSMHPWLESRRMRGLFTAGQINGTTGYEEAAAQGIVAGINAVRVGCAGGVSGQRPAGAVAPLSASPFVLSRSSSFIGVLISDLTRLGVVEPYRMFTSRSEFRLSIRQDNADRRLTQMAVDAGILATTNQRSAQLQIKRARIEEAERTIDACKQSKVAWNEVTTRLQSTRVLSASALSLSPSSARNGISVRTYLEGAPVSVTLAALRHLSPALAAGVHPSIAEDVEIDVRYRVHLQRQAREIEQFEKAQQCDLLLPSAEELRSPRWAFSHEDYDKLVSLRPRTLAEAHAIGVSPNALARLVQAHTH